MLNPTTHMRKANWFKISPFLVAMRERSISLFLSRSHPSPSALPFHSIHAEKTFPLHCSSEMLNKSLLKQKYKNYRKKNISKVKCGTLIVSSSKWQKPTTAKTATTKKMCSHSTTVEMKCVPHEYGSKNEDNSKTGPTQATKYNGRARARKSILRCKSNRFRLHRV